ncbi:hypothetical protein MASR2M48_23400 [Spirochaetota bacterium]
MIKKNLRPFIIVATALSVAMFVVMTISCIPDPLIAAFVTGDMRPPCVASWGSSSPSLVTITFDEDIDEAVPGFASSPGPGILSVELGDAGRSVCVRLDGEQSPGMAYAVSGMVADKAGNLSSFVLPYWGYNSRPPLVVFNELLTEGSKTHPDSIELFVKSEGLCSGMSLFIGTQDDFDIRYVFGPLEVAAGDYIVLHLKPQGLPEEIDETDDKSVSGGLDASATAWDLWFRDGEAALSGKNGVLSLCSSPNGTMMDAIAYSERTVDSDTKYGGFGTAALRDRVAFIVGASAWNASDPPRPEDCARSTGTTSTRTICRSSSSQDTDSGVDWHVVPTKGASLGGQNLDDVYVPL